MIHNYPYMNDDFFYINENKYIEKETIAEEFWKIILTMNQNRKIIDMKAMITCYRDDYDDTKDTKVFDERNKLVFSSNEKPESLDGFHLQNRNSPSISKLKIIFDDGGEEIYKIISFLPIEFYLRDSKINWDNCEYNTWY